MSRRNQELEENYKEMLQHNKKLIDYINKLIKNHTELLEMLEKNNLYQEVKILH